LGAIDRYRQILDDSPMHEGARDALEAMLKDEDTREAAAGVLEPLYRRNQEHAPLVEVLEVKLTGGDADARRARLADIATLHEQGLGDPAAAFKAWGRLLVEEPTDANAIWQLERLAGVLGNWNALAELFAERLSAVYEPEAQRMLALKLAALSEER